MKRNSTQLFIYILKVFGDYITIQDLKEMQSILHSKHENEHDKIYSLENYEFKFYKLKVKDLKNDFIEMLDSCYRPIRINGTNYPYSVVFETMDEMAFTIAFDDYVAEIMEELED